MNMKKTIAAIAAGAVAVSAMATTVSALEAKTLTYNLVKTEKGNESSGKITANFDSLTIAAGDTVEIEAKGAIVKWWDDVSFEISGSYWDDEAGANKSFNRIFCTDNTWEEGYSAEGTAILKNNVVTIPVKAKGEGTTVSLTSSSQANIKVVAKYKHLPAGLDAAAKLNAEIGETYGLRLKVISGGADRAPVTTVDAIATNFGYTDVDVEGMADGTYKYVAGAAASATSSNAAVTVTTAATFAPTQDSVLTYDGTDWVNAEGVAVSTTFIGLTITGTAAANDTITIKKAGEPHWEDAAGKPATVKLLNGKTATVDDLVKITTTAGVGAAKGTVVYDSEKYVGSASEVTAAGEKKYPYKSTLTNSTDVITSIYSTTDFNDQTDGTKVAKLIDPAAIRAVINDAVVNYDDVTFVFNTAAQHVKDEAYCESWEGTDYTSFGRHFWDSDPGYDANTVYIANDWIGNNLFEGALIINRNLTLSLGATDKFDWTATSLSFSWDAIQDAALTNNAYANYIQNMILRTSSTWYWDNFQVVLGATEEEEVGTTSPVEAEDEELEDTEDEPEVEAEEEEEEEEEESEPEPEPEPEVAPVAEKNPGTGNAPVALAVIPVALAAAAVVAKKRG